MDIEKAILLLDLEADLTPGAANPALKAALKLGIEALKRIKWSRHHGVLPPATSLPGETEE